MDCVVPAAGGGVGVSVGWWEGGKWRQISVSTYYRFLVMIVCWFCMFVGVLIGFFGFFLPSIALKYPQPTFLPRTHNFLECSKGSHRLKELSAPSSFSSFFKKYLLAVCT